MQALSFYRKLIEQIQKRIFLIVRLYQVQETSPCELELTNNIKCSKRLEIAGKFEFLFKMAPYLNGGIVWFFIIRVFLAAGVLASSRI